MIDTTKTRAVCRSFGIAALMLMSVLLPRRAWAGPEDRVEWGLHRVELERSTVVVRSRWSLTGRPEAAIGLATPLPAAAELSGAVGERAADGSIEALELPADHGGEIRLEVRVPWTDVQRTGALPVPVPRGDSVHRVVVSPTLSFSPDPALGLVAQVGHYAPADIDVVERHRFDARTDGDMRHVGAYYVRGDDLRSARALRGELVLRRERMGRAALVAGSIFGLVVLAMFLAHRKLGRRVRYEQAEAFLDAELDALEDHDFSLRSPPTERV